MCTATHQFKITRQWIMAGKAIFTVKNATGKHYTYCVRKVEDKASQRPPVWFLSALTGSDNEDDGSYSYIGMVVDSAPRIAGTNMAPNSIGTTMDNMLRPPLAIRLTAKSRFHKDSQIVKVAEWALRRICDGADLPDGYGIDGNGRCGRCGRVLTHPDGIADDGYRLGFGPVCWELMNS